MKPIAPFLSVLVLILASLACGSDATPALVSTSAPDSQGAEPSIATETSAPTTAPLTTYNVGDVVSIGDLTITVNEVTFPGGDDFNRPEAGKKFLVVDLTIENKGAEPAMISTLLQMSLKDETGQKYDVDIMASVASGGASPDGEIAAGDKLRGQVGFQVPETATSLVFIFDAMLFTGGQVRIAIPNQ